MLIKLLQLLNGTPLLYDMGIVSICSDQAGNFFSFERVGEVSGQFWAGRA